MHLHPIVQLSLQSLHLILLAQVQRYNLLQDVYKRQGIDTLKIGFNAVHGYYIQISQGQAHKAPIHYVRRQTLKNAERYIIPELKEYEDKVLK